MAADETDSGLETAGSNSPGEAERERMQNLVIDETHQDVVIFNGLTPEQLAVLAAASIYSKAFLETLGKRAGDGIADMVRTRIRKKGEIREALVGPKDGSAAILIVTSETPDEARLALLDLDVTAEDIRGKTLRWDNEAVAWRPESPEDQTGN